MSTAIVPGLVYQLPMYTGILYEDATYSNLGLIDGTALLKVKIVHPATNAGIFFFMDPLSAHPHQADIDSLVRLANVHNILTCINPCTAHAMSFLLKCALEQGRKDKIPSFFYSLKSPGVAVYKAEQKAALEANK